ncbi:MAG: SpoIIE family protein phosphatase [Anaerolineales bacterium]|nr:SpoIIE family protein phosphatase [Anaerolineales bacterium]
MDELGSSGILQASFQNRLDAAAVETLQRVAAFQRYPAGAVLARQGEPGHTFYVVVAGQVAITQALSDGEERLLDMLEGGDYFGEMALIDDTPRMATCTAVTDTTVLEITEPVFDRLVETNPTMAHVIMQRTVRNMRRLDQRAIAELTQKNAALEKAYAELQAAQLELVEKERLEKELELAAAVQRNLLPGKLPQYPDFRFAAFLEPARQVGGDFYDVIAIDDDHVGLLIADVADKGFHAALFMAVTRTLFLQASRRLLSPAAVAAEVHDGILRVTQADDVFVTAFYGVLHRPSRVLRYVRAGHERPLHLRPDGTVTPLAGNGRFLGMWPTLSVEEQEVRLQPGEHLLLFSDGVPDARSRQGEVFGLPRLTETLQQAVGRSAAELSLQVVQAVAQWSSGAAAFDDLTLLVLEAVS